MKYCEDDIIKARLILLHITTAIDDIKEYSSLINLNNEEYDKVRDGIDTIINIVNYGNNLHDDKLHKLIKMKKIMRGE